MRLEVGTAYQPSELGYKTCWQSVIDYGREEDNREREEDIEYAFGEHDAPRATALPDLLFDKRGVEARHGCFCSLHPHLGVYICGGAVDTSSSKTCLIAA